ncbi:hypothetical protein BGZ76_008375, partial [Entomortierella beljakovae]
MLYEAQELLANDDKKRPIKYSTLLGTTNDLGVDFHEDLKDPYTHNSLIVGQGTPHTCLLYTIPGNRICWHVQTQLKAKSSIEEYFRVSEWEPESNQDFLKSVYEIKTPYGDLKTLIDQTSKNNISRVFLEDKVYETWYHRRTVLIGDAAHKLLPSSGQGAVNAMQDAVILANCLYDMADWTSESITSAFKSYKDHRLPHVQAQFASSASSARIMFGQ